jgi:hypothetical protein
MVGTLLALALIGVAPASASAAGTWSAPVSIGGGANPVLVSCASASFCVAAENAAVVVFNGSSWLAPQTVDPGQVLSSVSCPVSAGGRFCAAVDDSGNVVFYRNGSWSVPASIGFPAGYETTLVSCASSSFCAAMLADYSTGPPGVGYASTFNGVSWTTPTLTDPGAFPVALSCPSSTFCADVDTNGGGVGYGTRYNGHAWSAPELITRTTPAGISCTSLSFCVEVSNLSNFAASESYYMVNNGIRWSAARSLSLSGTAGGVSCASALFCAAVGAGKATTFNGSSFTTPVPITTNSGSQVSLTSVSCPTSSFCAATGFTYAPGNPDYAVVYSTG